LPQLLQLVLHFTERHLEIDAVGAYEGFIKPFRNSLTIAGTLLFIALCLNLLANYEELYTFLGFFIYLSLSVSIAWLASKAAQQVILRSVINLLRSRGKEVNEIVLVFETLTNILIILLAVAIFARGLKLNLIALSASLGIGGIAVAFAAQQALGRLIGTVELYLDRPYVPGEYIRVNFNPYAEDLYGRVESIGLRSTKIRTAAQNTLVIVPNSMMAGMKIENITRGKKIMAMLCLEFVQRLQEGEKALVKQVIEQTSQTFWGFNKANMRIQFSQPEGKLGTRARVSFFITGSSEDSIGLRKRLLELANDAIAKNLSAYNLSFTIPEPMVYIDSPMSI
ncbi:MAG: mechanosensitive ion channel family protein, partial [Symploca sp. SIO1C4]|nr:mechanosensitive ion channel family protein [Symploca sp. SIO1C4]